MKSGTSLSPRAALAAATVVMGLATPGCFKGHEESGELLVSKSIGPEGGSIAGGGVTVTFPPGALSIETEIEIRVSKANLSIADFGMKDNARSLRPEGLSLAQPTRVEFGGAGAVLFEQDDLVVAATGSAAYVNELGTVAAADAGTPRIVATTPMLSATPEGVGTAIRDLVNFQLQVTDTPELDLVLSIYDTAQVYDRALNGQGSGDCGFKIEAPLIGGSLAGGCNEGFATATLRSSSQVLEFDVSTFLAGKLDTPVTVGVVAGNNAAAYQLGFFSFDTSPCQGETCSGRGTCTAPAGGEAVCECEAGYAAMGLSCVCVPQCDGRQCGFDSCDGECGQCGDGMSCDEENGQCVNNPVDDDDDGTAGDTMMGSDTMGGESTTGMGGESTDSTTSGGSSSGGSGSGSGSGSTG